MYSSDGERLYETAGILFIIIGGIFCAVGAGGCFSQLIVGQLLDDAESFTLFLVFLLIGPLLLLTGILLKWRYRTIMRKRQDLIENGQKLYARVVQVKCDYRYQRAHSYAKKLICRYTAPDEGEYTFISGPIWTNAPEELIGKMVPVYIRRGEPDHYHVDIRTVSPGLEIRIH